jgi:hypothetical protein
MTRRIKLPRPSEEMRYWCALLAEEMLSWPEVSARPMFGMRAFYRKKAIFALLPDKRALENPSAIGFKEGGKWKSFEMAGEEGIGAALAVLGKAYAEP